MHLQVPFALLATAYRRKRIMEGLISGDREVMAQVCVCGGSTAAPCAVTYNMHGSKAHYISEAQLWLTSSSRWLCSPHS